MVSHLASEPTKKQALLSTMGRKQTYISDLEIGVQETHKRRPNLSGDALLELAHIVRRLFGDSVTRSAFGHKRTFELSGRIRFVCLHTFRNRDPRLFATGPYMHVRL
jgi:hypothetical protein